MHSIRHLDDEEEIIKLFPLIIAGGLERGVDVTKLNPDKLWHALNACMVHGALIVAGDVEIDGFIGIYPQECYWSDDVDLFTLMIQVRKERRGNIGLKLIKAAKKFADNRKMNLFIHSAGEDQDRQNVMFERFGFRKHHTNCKREF